MEKDMIKFYTFAKKVCISEGFKEEIDMVESRTLDKISEKDFFREYVFVVCNSGMKNKIATKIFKKYFEIGLDAINHPGKKAAISQLEIYYKEWFNILQSMKTDKDRLGLMNILPFIGNITKYHLARNLGIDCAKPDRHLQRIANHFKYNDVQTMCSYISNETGDRIGTVDVVLWRAMQLKRGSIRKIIDDV